MKHRIFSRILTLLLAVCMLVSALPVYAVDDGVDTQTTTNVEQPFSSGTENSTYFRIPAIVTLNDGTLVAAADARWDGTSDGNGIDTLVAVSSDNGATWSHNFAAYLGDNQTTGKTDTTNGTFIDPELATDGETVWMLVDLFPRGLSNLNTGLTGDAFTSDGHLRLSNGSASTDSSYTYYLGDFSTENDESEQRASIYKTNSNNKYGWSYTSAVSGYTVDRWFNLYQNGELVSNLFYSDAAYQAYPAQYLYLVKSEDSGNTWSAPQLIDLRENGEIFYGTGTGSGRVLGVNGKQTIIFPCYGCEKIGTDLRASYIYSTDGGETWTRSWGRDDETFQTCSSEATITEVKVGDKTYWYAFSRYLTNSWGFKSSGAYYVSSDFGATWEAKSDISYSCGDAMGVITYSELLGGKPAILLSASGNNSSTYRKNGRIYTYLVNEDGSLELANTFEVTGSSEYYRYSDLTELSDGSIGLLYESESGYIAYENLDIVDVTGRVPDKTVTDSASNITVTAPGLTGVEVTIEETPASAPAGAEVKAYDITPSTTNGDYEREATVTFSCPENWTDETRIKGFIENGDGTYNWDLTATKSGNTVSVTFPHFSVGGIYYAAELADNGSDSTQITVNVTMAVGETSETYTVVGHHANDYTNTLKGIATISATERTEGGETTYTLASIANGTFYISDNANDSAPTMQVTIEDYNGSTCYIKYGNSYVYPDASRNVGYWVYSSKTETNKTNSLTATSSNTGYKFSRSVSDTTIFGEIKTTTTTTTIENGSFGASNNGETLYLYTAGTTPVDKYTNISFIGVKAGTESVTIGNTTFNVTVERKNETVNLSIGGTATYTDSGSFTNSDSSVASAEIEDGTLTITGLSNGTTIITTDTTVYTVIVSDVIDATLTGPFIGGTTNVANGYVPNDHKTYTAVCSRNEPLTRITMNEGLSFDVDLNIDGSSVVWGVDNADYATVSNDGVITALAAGTTYLTATVDGVTYRVPLVILENDSRADLDCGLIYHFYFKEIINTRVYYSTYCSSELHEVQAGEVIYMTANNVSGATGEMCIDFFAAPIEGYALTSIVQTLNYTAGDETGDAYFYRLCNDAGELDLTSTDAYYKGSKSTASRRINNYSDEMTKSMMKAAVDVGCDATNGYSNNIFCLSPQLSYRSEKLPTVEKTVKCVKDSNGNEKTGADAKFVEVGDTVVFTITTTRYLTIDESATITYSNVYLTDNLTGVTGVKSPDLGTSTTTDKQFTCDVELKLTDENFGAVVKDGKITNTVELSYTYKATYSYGSKKDKAFASAEVTARVPVVVVDFGLPITADLSTVSELMNWTINNIETDASKGGTAVQDTNDKNKITFTPIEVLDDTNGYVTIHATDSNSKDRTYGVRFVPASNVLYEANFLTQTGAGAAWTGGNKNTVQQTSDQQALYGYDDAYKTSTGKLASAYTISGLESGNSSRYLKTSFYGTGFDLIGSCADNSAYIALMIKSTDEGGTNKLILIDPTYTGGRTLYQVPLAHVTDLPEGNYEVRIGAIYRKVTADVTTTNSRAMYSMSASPLDEIYDFVDELLAEGVEIDDVSYVYFDSGSALAELDGAVAATYALDAADTTIVNPHKTAGTAACIEGFRVYRSSNNSSYITSEQNVTYVNVLDAINNNFSAYVDGDGKGSYTVEDYEASGGPQNEVYLAYGQSITLKANTNAIQVSLRSVNGQSVTAKFSGKEIATLSHATEMYYTLTPGDDSSSLYTITNEGNSLLAVCNFKLADGAQTQALTEDDYPVVFAMLSRSVEPTEPDEPETPAFTPTSLDTRVDTVRLWSKSLVTLTVTTSTDVDHIVVNGKTYYPVNQRLVKWGLVKSYVFTIATTVPAGETPSFEIVAYDANGLASNVYTAQG